MVKSGDAAQQYDPLMALVVRVSGEYFPDDDDICLTAGKYVCGRLEADLIRIGHSIPEWVRGGCDEDWGVFYRSQLGNESFDYQVCFFPDQFDEQHYYLAIQYHITPPWLSWFFGKPPQLGPNHPLHETMRNFGRSFESSRMLTKSQFDAEI